MKRRLFDSAQWRSYHCLQVARNPPPPFKASNLFPIVRQLSTKPRDTCAQFGIPKPGNCCSNVKKNSRHVASCTWLCLRTNSRPSRHAHVAIYFNFSKMSSASRLPCTSIKHTIVSIQYCKMIGIELVTINLYPVH